MKNILEAQILSKDFQLEDIISKINIFWVSGELTEPDRNQLIDLAREKADPGQKTEIMEKLIEFEARISALEAGNVNQNPEGPTEPVIEEYKDGEWYRNGRRVIFEGNIYECSGVPDGQVCVWSPAAYPAYWVLIGPAE